MNCRCSIVAWWLALLHPSKKVPGSNLGRGFSVWNLHVVPMLVLVFSGYSSFLPQSKDMHVRLVGGSKLPVGVIVSVHGCSFVCGPVMDC